MSITDFDESEKRAVSTTDSTGRMQEVTFLTEKGLYKVLFRSRKPIAQKFQNSRYKYLINTIHLQK